MKTILVVEDFAYARYFICKTLQNKGYNTLGAATAQEAYELLEQDPTEVSLVLSDFDNDGTNGFDLLKTIKNNICMEDIPVVFLTTSYHTDKIRFARESGLAAFIEKPFREDKFFSEIDRAINMKGSIRNLGFA
jgi:two-component system, chemotaxis family, chemotaxis protein CheY